ncbi:DUF2971 domain-containing protein [Shewanella baltica]|uniref:DUF2971 domain-containing protein n=1 Tax=Shewanella baltica TaxID=62322 RepID=UPI00217EF080|nr:DUF2971 domain-containing protein [Shewanella baltica]MCS6160741.1 DUF2971 domain-containing protein [Shewanella baltica]MCS6241406.1 DUF2971 domain-containing protein [Shewanella baltica]
MEKPEFLYHYTSIEGLAHILSSKKIRFSRLDFLDDMEEGGSKDPVDWRKYFFVSCWTSTSEESIPLWSMYTKNMTGVRIKVKTDMFQKYQLDAECIPKFLKIADTSSAPPGSKIMLQTYMPYDEMHGEDYMVLPPSWGDDFWPFPVEYTNDEERLSQQLIHYNVETDQTMVRSFEIAKYKRKVWRFQDEWRFRLYCHSAAPRSLMSKMGEQEYFELMVRALSTLGGGISKEYFYLALDDEAFNNVEILLGPKVDIAHEIMVKALIDSHCPSATLSSSNLKGKIK